MPLWQWRKTAADRARRRVAPSCGRRRSAETPRPLISWDSLLTRQQLFAHTRYWQVRAQWERGPQRGNRSATTILDLPLNTEQEPSAPLGCLAIVFVCKERRIPPRLLSPIRASTFIGILFHLLAGFCLLVEERDGGPGVGSVTAARVLAPPQERAAHGRVSGARTWRKELGCGATMRRSGCPRR